MPCDSLIYNSVDFSSAKNHEGLLEEALRNKGYTVYRSGDSIRFYDNRTGVDGTYRAGSFSVTDGFNVDSIKQEFGRVVVKAAAKKFGWTVKEEPNGKMKVSKRA